MTITLLKQCWNSKLSPLQKRACGVYCPFPDDMLNMQGAKYLCGSAKVKKIF